MGLMVRRGNPLGIDSIERLVDPGVRFVNRDPESGTRSLFDRLLALHRLDETKIDGFERIEFTHAAVAAYVASGMADVSFGVEAAARQFDLDFVRLVTEDYVLVCGKNIVEEPPVLQLLEILRSTEFGAAIAQLPGYVAKDAGSRQGRERGAALTGPALTGPALTGPALRGPALRGPALRRRVRGPASATC